MVVRMSLDGMTAMENCTIAIGKSSLSTSLFLSLSYLTIR